MKKLFTLLMLGLVILLSACNREMVFEPVTIDGFTVGIENTIFPFSVDDEILSVDEILDQLAELDIELSVVNEKEFIFSLMTLQDDVIVEVDKLTVSAYEKAIFEPITFYEIGIFVYEIMLNGEVVETVTVKITADEESEILVADVSMMDFVFNNIIKIDVTEYLQPIENLIIEDESYEELADDESEADDSTENNAPTTSTNNNSTNQNNNNDTTGNNNNNNSGSTQNNNPPTGDNNSNNNQTPSPPRTCEFVAVSFSGTYTVTTGYEWDDLWNVYRPTGSEIRWSAELPIAQYYSWRASRPGAQTFITFAEVCS